jgi:bacterioferritin
MKGNPKIIDHLNQALRLELTAINQYWLHFRLVEEWGYARLAKHEREASIEEMRHADRLADRILFLEGLPNMQELNRLRIGREVKEVLESDLAGERDLLAAYRAAGEACRAIDDFGSVALFDDLIRDEEAHVSFLQSELRLLDEIGIDEYGRRQIEPPDSVEAEAIPQE